MDIHVFQLHQGKLQILDLRNVHQFFWNIWASAEDSIRSAETLDKKQIVKVFPRNALRQCLNVIDDLCVRICLNETQACFLKRDWQRKGRLHFYYTKMKIWAPSLQVIREILNVFDIQHMIELKLYI